MSKKQKIQSPRSNRDDFSKSIWMLLGQRVGWLCSNPGCQRPTIGPRMGEPGSMNIGVAAHITAASPGFARYDPSLTSEQRKAYSNGIWLCQDHAHQIDHDENHFTVQLLNQWKLNAEARAFRQLTEGRGPAQVFSIPEEFLDDLHDALASLSLPKDEDLLSIRTRVGFAALRHIGAFEAEPRWPAHAVKLSLFTSYDDEEGFQVYNVDQLGPAIRAAQRLSVVAPPGTGKSTTLLQLARVVQSIGPVALFVPLSEWAETGSDLFTWIANRHAFAGIRPERLKFLAHHGELVWLLDGWNEVPDKARQKLIQELKGLLRDFPLLCIVMSTRRQALDVPISGPQINVAPLSQAQQAEIAKASNGQDGLRILERAQGTRGLRELISIPLYLTALLRISASGTLPQTKEELLRIFIQEHEKQPERAEVLDRVLGGNHPTYLKALAVSAHRESNTSISAASAQVAIGAVNDLLKTTYKVEVPPNPKMVLDGLVNTHVIQCEDDDAYSFQHQQLQEWYASLEVEQNIVQRADQSIKLSDRFAVECIDNRFWEEAILFACERLARKSEHGAAAVANLVCACLGIDPMLAAAIIDRSGAPVWVLVSSRVVTFAKLWHQANTIDRAVGFMIATGRHEFAEVVWPLIAGDASTIRVSALRAAGRFNLSVLGNLLDEEYKSLDEGARGTLLSEFAHNGGVDGMAMAEKLARTDVSAAVRSEVIASLLFRGAVRSAETLLHSSDETVWKLLAENGYFDAVEREDTKRRLEAYRSDFLKEKPPHVRLRYFADLADPSDQADYVRETLADPDFDFRSDGIGWVITEVAKKYPGAVASALKDRIVAGSSLPLSAAPYLDPLPTLDTGDVVDIVLSSSPSNPRTKYGAYLVGPRTIHELIERYLADRLKVLNAGKPVSETEYRHIREQADLIELTRLAPFAETLLGFQSEDDSRRVYALSDLIVRHKGNDPSVERLSNGLRNGMVRMMNGWAQSVLASTTVKKRDIAQLASAMSRYPDDSQVEPLSRMLDFDLRQLRRARDVLIDKPRDQSALQEARISHAWTFRDAFAAVGTVSAADKLKTYLRDPIFGESAAKGLQIIWYRKAPKRDSENFRTGLDLELASENRKLRQTSPDETSEYADAIFGVVEELTSTGDVKALKRAIIMASIGVRMPHGDRAAILARLVSATVPIGVKLSLLVSMVIGGIAVKANDLLGGLDQLFHEARQEPWLLGQDSDTVFRWLELFPFSDQPMALVDVLGHMPKSLRYPLWRLRDLLVSIVPISASSVELLRALGEKFPSLLRDYEWYLALLRFPTNEALRLILDISEGRLGAPSDLKAAGHRVPEMLRSKMQIDDLAPLVEVFSSMPEGPGKEFVASVLAEDTNDQTFLVLAADSTGRKAIERRFHYSIEDIAYQKTELSGEGYHFELTPRDARTVRRGLFALATSATTPDLARFAVRCLEEIDSTRDEYGEIETEPRHPDISSGVAWPFLQSA